MSERSIYLRDQADKCRQHANIVGDARTREELRKLAAVYIALAEQIESKGRLEPPTEVVGDGSTLVRIRELSRKSFASDSLPSAVSPTSAKLSFTVSPWHPRTKTPR